MRLKINISYYPDLTGETLLGNYITDGVIFTIFFPDDFTTNKYTTLYVSDVSKSCYDGVIELLRDIKENPQLEREKVSFTMICSGFPDSYKIHNPTTKKKKAGNIVKIIKNYLERLFTSEDIEDLLWNDETEETYINILSVINHELFWGDNPETTLMEFDFDIDEKYIKSFLINCITSNYMKSRQSWENMSLRCLVKMALTAGITLKDILPPP